MSRLLTSVPIGRNGLAAMDIVPVRMMSSSARKIHEKYIHPQSRIPTFHFQKSLPRLKIPELDKTLDRYLLAVKPLLTEEEYKTTQSVVEDFRKGSGPDLHSKLVAEDKANKHTSYISAPWFDMYLKDRAPLPINYNPQITMNDHPNPKQNQQAERAAGLIAAALKFQSSLKDEVLVPDIFHTQPEKSETNFFSSFVRLLPQSVSFYGAYLFGAYPLDMSQYSRLFASTRVPTVGKDVLQSYPSSEHVVIMRNNHFYKLYVRDQSGKFISEAEILAGIKEILADTEGRAKEAIGILTTENRDKWAGLRTELYNTNKESVEAIDSGLFVVSLDDEKVEDPSKLSRLFLFGDGRNRWFDKSFSLIVTGNGKAAVNFEHSWGDGVAVKRFLEEVYYESSAAPLVQPKAAPRPVEKLKWKLTPAVQKGIEEAAKRFDAETATMDLEVLTTDVVKRQQLKDFKVSPDGFLQMSFQLAYDKLFNKTVTTYESASTAAFKHGRTEAIRSATLQSVAFTQTMRDPKATAQAKSDALRAAINNHSKISVDAMTGNGIDRHLFAMRYLAQQRGLPLHPIYQDKAYQLLNTNLLSTSTLSSPAIVLGAFGPVAEHGYGIGYGMDEGNLRFNITAFKKVHPFISKVEESLKEMTQLLTSVPPPQPKNK